MIQVKVFWNSQSQGEAYDEVEQEANNYLQTNGITREQIISTHVTSWASGNWTEYAITFVLEVPTTKEEIPHVEAHYDLTFPDGE